jgi:hypothetical protein
MITGVNIQCVGEYMFVVRLGKIRKEVSLDFPLPETIITDSLRRKGYVPVVLNAACVVSASA